MSWNLIATSRPAHKAPVLVCNAGNPAWLPRVLHFDSRTGEWVDDAFCVYHNLTHWHELPKLPKPA